MRHGVFGLQPRPVHAARGRVESTARPAAATDPRLHGHRTHRNLSNNTGHHRSAEVNTGQQRSTQVIRCHHRSQRRKMTPQQAAQSARFTGL